MSSFRIRPRFKHRIEGTKPEIELRIKEALTQQVGQFAYDQLPDHIHIKIRPEDRHVWSPQLDLSFEQDENEVIVRGLYGPNPTTWAFFFFSYVALGILSLFIGMWGLSLYSLDQDAQILYLIPIFAAIALVLYIISQTGQKLGAQQMFDIHHFYEGITHDKVIVN